MPFRIFEAAGMARPIERLRSDPALGRRLGQAGCTYLTERFDRVRLAEAYLRILGETQHRHLT